jgi:hypothetical protein
VTHVEARIGSDELTPALLSGGLARDCLEFRKNRFDPSVIPSLEAAACSEAFWLPSTDRCDMGHRPIAACNRESKRMHLIPS